MSCLRSPVTHKRLRRASCASLLVVVLHGCDGLSTLSKEWTQHVADVLNAQGIGAMVFDSFTTRYVDNSCCLADLHWGRRRSDDA